MEATNLTFHSQGIVQEVLTKDNYERWKTLMKNYLVGKNLWDDVVEGTTVLVSGKKSVLDPRRRRRKDAEALHIIQRSCGPKILDEISRFGTAKDAWNHLGARYGIELKATPDIEQGVLDDNLLYCKPLYRHVEKGDWKAAESFIKVRKDALFSTSASGRTVLHVAVLAGHVHIVEGLVKIGKDKLVKMQDDRGYTALALAAHYTGNTDVARRMVEGQNRGFRNDLLAIKNEDSEIPVLLAAGKGHAHMTRYLYSLDQRKVLNGQDSRNRVLLFARCIKAEIFDVALGLLQSYPDLPKESLSDGFLALHALAKTPSAFYSGCRFGLGQQIIYKILRVEKNFQDRWRIDSVMTLSSEGRHESFSLDAYEIQTAALGRFSKRVLIFPVLPVKLLGRLLFEIVHAFVLLFERLNISGVSEIYYRKYTHYQVQQILMYLQRSIAEFNDAQLRQALVYDAMLDAARHGIVEFINAMTEANHDLLWAMDNRKRGIFSYAILHRKEKVFRLIHTLNGRKDIIKYRTDVFGNNLLHLAGHLGPSSDLNHRPGAALQMQREIQWFKAAEAVVHPKCKEAKNDDYKMPHDIFTESHRELLLAGEKWAKETAGSFTLVGTLITTIMFAAAFTVPGGNHQETGVPIFSNNKLFTAFLVGDAVSLFTSATSVLIFIGILTSRYSEKDFLKSLPWKLILGLVFLFLSVMSMMVAFCAALAMILTAYRAYTRLITAATICGSVPVIVLVASQLRLIFEILRSTISNPIGYAKT